MFKISLQWIRCRRDAVMVSIAKYFLSKVDRFFNTYWCAAVLMLIMFGPIFWVGLMGASPSLFGFPGWVGVAIAMLAPLSMGFLMCIAQNWIQGSEEISNQRAMFNQVMSHYGLAQRSHYIRAEAWLINAYLAPGKRIEQAARQLECSTQSATSSGQARRL